jgi:hypothetical protein
MWYGLNISKRFHLPSGMSEAHVLVMRAFALGLLALAAAKKKGAVEATDKNFDDIVHNSGKGAFIKFLAPW